MSLNSPGQKKTTPSRTSVSKFLKSYSFLTPTLALLFLGFVGGTWKLALFINDKQKERREQTLHITQEIIVTTGELNKGRIPILVQFKITNTGKSIAYILPGGFKMEGINFADKLEGQKPYMKRNTNEMMGVTTSEKCQLYWLTAKIKRHRATAKAITSSHQPQYCLNRQVKKVEDFQSLLEKIERRDETLLYHDASRMDNSYKRVKTLIAAGALFVGSTRMHYMKEDGAALIYDPKEPARKFEYNESAQENFLFFVKPGDYEYIILVGIVPFVSDQEEIWSRIKFDIDQSFVNVVPCYATGSKGDACKEDINSEEKEGREFLDAHTFTPIITFKYISLKH